MENRLEILKTNNLTLRAASNKDSKEIKEHIFSILKTYRLYPDLNGVDSDLEDIESNFINSGGLFDVLTFENKIIGTTALFPESNKTCELRKMYLDPSFRGKGLGRFLLEYSIEKAKKLGFSKITLETASVLKEAIGLYESYGFIDFEGSTCNRCDQTYYLEI